MENPFKTREKQAQTSVFQTAQMQENQVPVVMNKHPEQMQETNRTAARAGFAQKSSPFDKAKKEVKQAETVQQEPQPDTEDVYTLAPSSIRNNFSDERLDAFHKNLVENVTGDMADAVNKKMPGVTEQELRAYQSMLSVIDIYVKMDPMQTSRAQQAKALRNAISATDSYLKKYGKANPEENNLAAYRAIKYKDYFAIMTNGYLHENKEAPGIKINATKKEDEPGLIRSFKHKVHYADRRHDQLFPHEPSMNDIEQLGLGDCYLQAAVSSLVMNDPQQLKESMKDNGDGTVTVRFYKQCSRLTSEEKKEYLDAQKSNLKNLSDGDLIFKLLQYCGDQSISDFVRKIFEDDKTSQRLKYMEEHDLATEEGLQQYQDFLMELEDKIIRLKDMMNKNGSMQHGEYTRRLANYLANQADVKEQVIGNMNRLLSQEDADPDMIIKQALIRLFSLMPDYKEQSSLDTPEFHALLEEQANGKPLDNEMVPVYVTVTKKVPVRDDSEDAYTGNCLWMQLLEKAYVASGLHDNGELQARIVKNQQEVKELEDRLTNENKSPAEIERQVNNLKAEQEKQLQQWKHSFEAIEGGVSGEFLKTFTGKQATIRNLEQMTPDLMCQQLQKNEVGDKLRQADQHWDVEKVQAVLHCVLNAVEQELKKQAIEMDGVKYYAKPFYIEDILDLLEGADENTEWVQAEPMIEWSLNSLKRMKEMEDPQADPQIYTVTNFFQLLKDNLSEAIADNPDITILHRPSSKKYTFYALEQYQILSDALVDKKAINIGTRKFLPEGVKATGRNGESEQDGLVEKHAYTVVDVFEENGILFVRLRNPWASGELGYKKTTYPDDTEMLTSHRVEAKTNGHFNMEWNHFLSKVRNIDFN